MLKRGDAVVENAEDTQRYQTQLLDRQTHGYEQAERGETALTWIYASIVDGAFTQNGLTSIKKRHNHSTSSMQFFLEYSVFVDTTCTSTCQNRGGRGIQEKPVPLRQSANLAV